MATSPSPCATAENAAPAEKPWFLYLLACKGNKLYAGVSTDVDKRFKAHSTGKGARYTRANPPLRIVGVRQFANRSLAQQAEHQIKRLSIPKKLQFIAAP